MPARVAYGSTLVTAPSSPCTAPAPPESPFTEAVATGFSGFAAGSLLLVLAATAAWIAAGGAPLETGGDASAVCGASSVSLLADGAQPSALSPPKNKSATPRTRRSIHACPEN